MEVLILLFWFCLFVVVPVVLIVAGFIGIRQNLNPMAVISGCFLGVLVHVTVMTFTLLPIFFVVYAGAHTTPPGDAISWKGELLFLALEFFYTFIVISGCSLLAGRPRPWPIKLELTDDIP
jgi:hypothetical protein